MGVTTERYVLPIIGEGYIDENGNVIGKEDNPIRPVGVRFLQYENGRSYKQYIVEYNFDTNLCVIDIEADEEWHHLFKEVLNNSTKRELYTLHHEGECEVVIRNETGIEWVKQIKCYDI